MTTRDELAAAAASDPALEVGTRLFEDGSSPRSATWLPGQSAPFRISLPVRDLADHRGPGVYWIGVHALGQDAAGRDGVADGRARTFIPLVDAKAHASVAARRTGARTGTP